MAIRRNDTSLGRVKASLIKMIREVGYDFEYTDLRGKCMGDPVTTPEFAACARYRGVPFARCGMRVRLFDGSEGVITGHTSSACFKVLFASGRNAGAELSCHPNSELSYLNEDGSLIKQLT